MNTRPLPPSCRRCGGEGSLEDPWDTCPDCHGTGEAVVDARRAGIVAALCIGAALVGYHLPSLWWVTT